MFILIGNILSLIAATFMAVSSLAKRRSVIFTLQFFECFILAVASFFFSSYAAIATLLLCAIRNLLTAKDMFGKKMMYIFFVLTAVLGIITNNRGIIGLLPVIATLQYTVCSHIFKGLFLTRISIFVNTAIWVIYSFIIKDFSTGIVDSVVLLTTTFGIIKLLIDIKKDKACTK